MRKELVRLIPLERPGIFVGWTNAVGVGTIQAMPTNASRTDHPSLSEHARCFEIHGCPVGNAAAISPTCFSVSASNTRTSPRRGVASALKTSLEVSTRDINIYIPIWEYMSNAPQK